MKEQSLLFTQTELFLSLPHKILCHIEMYSALGLERVYAFWFQCVSFWNDKLFFLCCINYCIALWKVNNAFPVQWLLFVISEFTWWCGQTIVYIALPTILPISDFALFADMVNLSQLFSCKIVTMLAFSVRIANIYGGLFFEGLVKAYHWWSPVLPALYYVHHMLGKGFLHLCECFFTILELSSCLVHYCSAQAHIA